MSPRRTRRPSDADKVGRYKLVGNQGGSLLQCLICGRQASLLSNVGLVAELNRLRTANGVIVPGACPTTACDNHARPVSTHPDEYHRHGLTRFGAQRMRCQRCRATLTLGNHYRTKRAGDVNRDIVKDLVNRGALNAILRKLGIGPTALYDRIDFIHHQMLAFEAFKLKKLKSAPKRKHFALATDAQDYQVNWATRDRRFGIKLSTITTADNYTGFILRTDVNFDPAVGDVVEHFKFLLERKDFAVEEGLGISHRYTLPAFLRAVAYALRARALKGSDQVQETLQRALKALYPNLDTADTLSSANPIRGAIIKNNYTAIAHFMLIAEMLPADADLHLMSDPDGSFIAAEPVGFVVPLREKRADLTFVTFNKGMTTPKKQALVGAYKKQLEEFIASECDPTADVAAIRYAFIERFARSLGIGYAGVQANWWTVPVQTMYEPEKKVGIAYQRAIGSDEDMNERRRELLDRASLHAVDSFFNVMRQRVSYFHRAGMSRSSQSFYNAFQPYRPEMVQKIVDIARVYFNWVEPRPFRLARKFTALEPTEFDTSHRHLASVHVERVRRCRREEFSTPAMRLGLAKRPIRLDTILYTDWLSRLHGSDRRAAARTSNRTNSQWRRPDMRQRPSGPGDWVARNNPESEFRESCCQRTP